jgi:hypothetical protein
MQVDANRLLIYFIKSLNPPIPTDQREICPHSVVYSSQIHLRLRTHPQMKRFLKPGKTARGVSLAILQPLRHLLDAIPVPGAKDVISILLDVVEGFDVSAKLPWFRIHTHCPFPENFPKQLDALRARKSLETFNPSFGAPDENGET